MISTKHHTNRTLCEVDWIKRIRPTCKTTTRTRTSAPRGSCRPAAGFALWKSSQRRKRKCVCGLMEPGVIIGPAPRPRSPCTALCVCVCVSNQFHMFRSDSPQNYVRFVSLTLTSKIRFWFLVELRELRVSFHPDVCKQPRCQSALKQHCEALLSARSQRTGLHTEQNHQRSVSGPSVFLQWRIYSDVVHRFRPHVNNVREFWVHVTFLTLFQ